MLRRERRRVLVCEGRLALLAHRPSTQALELVRGVFGRHWVFERRHCESILGAWPDH